MNKILSPSIFLAVFCTVSALAQDSFEKDVINTSDGDLEITFIGHGSLMVALKGKIIQIDPYGNSAYYSKLPKADMIILTHDHFDHLDISALKKIQSDKTIIIYTEKCAEKLKGHIIMKNGDIKTIQGIKIEAVPAYNIVHKREDGQFYHPKGDGNGYILTFGNKRVYVAGDTENTPEMKALKNIDVAFLPMNLPYTMTPEMVDDAAKSFKPNILYPYHYGDTDPSKLLELIKGNKEIETRIRQMK